MGLSEKITELAEQYDPDREADAAMSRSLLQGALVGTFMRDVKGGVFGNVVKIHDVEQDQDADGVYLPHFTVITGAGHRVRITLEVEGA